MLYDVDSIRASIRPELGGPSHGRPLFGRRVSNSEHHRIQLFDHLAGVPAFAIHTLLSAVL